MGRDNSPKIRRRADIARKQARRATYDRILIVCEGSKTEPNYLIEIRRAYRLQTANVVIHPSELGTAPIQVVQYAKELLENGHPHKHIKARAFERAYVVFDRDDHESFFEAQHLVESLKGKILNDEKKPIVFETIVSVPCFELWLLLHFEDILHAIHRKEVLKRLKRHIPTYDKTMSNAFSITKSKLDIAHKRAQLLSKQKTDGALPYTDISKLLYVLTELGI